MGIATASRASNSKGQFILPAIPAGTSANLVNMIEEYRVGFWALAEDQQPRWEAAARQISEFEPDSLVDLAAKIIIAIHYRDPECDGDALAIEAPEPQADRLAIEMELDCLDWMLARIRDTPPGSSAWSAAEAAFQKADADLEALEAPFTDEELDRLADIRGDAIDSLLDLPAVTVGQALRKIELAMFDGTMVRSGVDFPALLAEARQLGADDSVVANVATVDPVTLAWESFRGAFRPDQELTEDQYETRFDETTDAADDVLANKPATTLAGIVAKLRRGFIANTTDWWAERLAIGENTSDNRRHLELADLYTRMAWGAVDDLERLAGNTVR